MIGKQPSLLLYITLVVLSTISSMATNLYIPAMPAMGDALGASEPLMQSSLVIYMAAFAVVPLILGPVAERVGSRTMVLTTLVFTLISHGFILTASIQGLLVGRCLQGAAMGLVTISARALLANMFAGKTLARVQSWTQCFSPIVTISSPLLGGILFKMFGWQGIFVFFSLVVVIVWGLSYLCIETQPSHKLSDQTLSFKQYLPLLKSQSFIKFGCLPAVAMIGQSAYLCKSAFILQKTYHLSPVAFGFCAVPVYGVLILSAMLNIYLLKFYEPRQLLKIGSMMMLLSAAILGLHAVLMQAQLILMILSCMLYFLSNSLLATNAYALASEQAKSSQNCAFAFMSLLKMTAGIITTAVAAYLPNQVSTLMLFFMIAGGLSYAIHGRNERVATFATILRLKALNVWRWIFSDFVKLFFYHRP